MIRPILFATRFNPQYRRSCKWSTSMSHNQIGRTGTDTRPRRNAKERAKTGPPTIEQLLAIPALVGVPGPYGSLVRIEIVRSAGDSGLETSQRCQVAPDHDEFTVC